MDEIKTKRSQLTKREWAIYKTIKKANPKCKTAYAIVQARAVCGSLTKRKK